MWEDFGRVLLGVLLYVEKSGLWITLSAIGFFFRIILGLTPPYWHLLVANVSENLPPCPSPEAQVRVEWGAFFLQWKFPVGSPASSH